jgi:hypothetical protein
MLWHVRINIRPECRFATVIPVLWKILSFCPPPYKFKKSPYRQGGFVWWLPIVSSKYRHLSKFCYVKVYSTNQNRNLLLLDDPGRVWSQITNVVFQIQRFDFECNLVVTRKVIIRTCAPLRLKPLLKINASKFTRGVLIKNASGLAPWRAFLSSMWSYSMSRTWGRNPIAKKLRCGRMVRYTE